MLPAQLTPSIPASTREVRTGGAPFPYHGRVRTGCLTCRGRKIKCTEERPECVKCARSKRQCIWKERPYWNNRAAGCSEDVSPNSTVHLSQPGTHHEADLSSPGESRHGTLTYDSPAQEEAPLSSEPGHEYNQLASSPHHVADHTASSHAATFLNSPSAQALMTSQDIYLCTTIDLMAATKSPRETTFDYFVSDVQVPLISSFDATNWHRLKVHMKSLATRSKGVAVAIQAVEALYKTQVNSLPSSYAIARCTSAHQEFDAALNDETQDVQILIVIAFLLCLAEVMLPTEPGSLLLASGGGLVRRLAAWSLPEQLPSASTSSMVLRIIAYMEILHAAARRGGGPGLMSSTVRSLLPALPGDLPDLPLPDDQQDAVTRISEILSGPVFLLYLDFQVTSAEIAEWSHYHRSRITSADQEKANEQLGRLRTRMHESWASRPSAMRLSPTELRVNLSPCIANPLITLIGLCIAAFHTEMVEIGRTLSDPPLASPEARQQMQHIREVIDGDWNALQDGVLNPGYLRPLFVSAIESINVDYTQWAIDRMKQIKNHICRSDFFASFATALVEAQRKKERRVTTKWFCYQTFGVAPPYV